MNCTEFESAVENAVEERTFVAAAVVQHTATCAKCRTFWDDQQRLDLAIAAWRGAQPPARLLDSVLAELANPVRPEEPEMFDETGDDVASTDRGIHAPLLRPSAIRTPEPQTSSSSVLALLSVAACLMIAAGFALQLTRPPAGQVAQVIHDRQQAPSTVVSAPVDVSQTLTAVLSDLQSEYDEMASETTSVARGVVNSIPRSVAVSVLPGSSFQHATGVPLLDPASDGPEPAASVWQPIGNGVESALGFLWQAVPSEIPAG